MLLAAEAACGERLVQAHIGHIYKALGHLPTIDIERQVLPVELQYDQTAASFRLNETETSPSVRAKVPGTGRQFLTIERLLRFDHQHTAQGGMILNLTDDAV